MEFDWKSIASLFATLLFIRSTLRELIPPELRSFLLSLGGRLFSFLNPNATFIINEIDGGSTNYLFYAAETYLSTRCLSSPTTNSSTAAANAHVLRLYRRRCSSRLSTSLPPSHSLVDNSFDSIPITWTFSCSNKETSGSRGHTQEYKSYQLSFPLRYRDAVKRRYMDHIAEVSERIKFSERERKLYTNRSSRNFDDSGRDMWSSESFHHPSTFETLAIDPELKNDIITDLKRFSGRKDYYSRVGRAWKRGYLLCGPPGTGKTSLVAAIANFLEFDVYDLELTAVGSNTQLRKLLVSTSAKSIVVVEDVDCTIDLSDRNNKKEKDDKHHRRTMKSSDSSKTEDSEEETPNCSSNRGRSSVSLSGILNFVDGLWSSCVGERLMIFTTNHPDKLDPALLRPGRMDRTFELGYCGFPAFKTLSENYIGVGEEHELMEEAEELLENVKVTPADVAEMFMVCDGEEANNAMKKVVKELRRRMNTSAPTSEDGGAGENKENVEKLTANCDVKRLVNKDLGRRQKKKGMVSAAAVTENGFCDGHV